MISGGRALVANPQMGAALWFSRPLALAGHCVLQVEGNVAGVLEQLPVPGLRPAPLVYCIKGLSASRHPDSEGARPGKLISHYLD